MQYSINSTFLLKAFDLQLKAIIENDIKAFKVKRQIKNNVAFLQLIAA